MAQNRVVAFLRLRAYLLTPLEKYSSCGAVHGFALKLETMVCFRQARSSFVFEND